MVSMLNHSSAIAVEPSEAPVCTNHESSSW